MQAQITAEMSKLQEEPAQQAWQADQVASLQAKDQQLVEIMDTKNRCQFFLICTSSRWRK